MAKKKRRLKKSAKIILSAMALLIVLFCVLILKHESDRKAFQDAYDSLILQVNQDALIVEYGAEYDQSQLVSYASGEYVCSGEIDTFSVGTQTLTYTMETIDRKGHETVREFHVTVKVKDTAPAWIALKSENVVISQYDSFDPLDNIASVEDVVDGQLSYARTLIYNTYTAVSDVDTSTIGNYTVTVTAKDSNGLETRRSYTVEVISGEELIQETQQEYLSYAE